jgi:hypothetical protein
VGAALRKHAEMDRGRNVKPSARTVEQFLTEWLTSVKHSLKPSAYANHSTNVSAYVVPIFGRRRLQDITVPVLNAFYVHLLENGRVKKDDNGKMYEYWRPPTRRRRRLSAGIGAGASRSIGRPAWRRSRCATFPVCSIAH